MAPWCTIKRIVKKDEIRFKLMRSKLNSDVRDYFFDGVYDLAKKNKNILFLTSDHTAFSLGKFEKDMPKQFINLGISEQNIMSVSSGLALNGKIVFVYGIAPFVTFRCFEQINIDICSMNLNVNIVSMGSGLTYSSDGPTHHGTQDQAVMSTLPNFSIFNVSDPFTAKHLPQKTLKVNGPKLFRIEKGILNCLHTSKNVINNGFGYYSSNSKTLIISTGIMSQIGNDIYHYFNNKNKKISFLDLIQVKPVNENKLVRIIKKYKYIFSIEENMPFGSMSYLLSNLIVKNNLKTKLVAYTLPEKFLFNSGPRNWMQKKYGLDKNKIIQKINKYI